ncbi:hypothetical protein DYY65_02090 [Nitrososphaera sp. AFS]|nr:hypothetical protein [Nitrososphaera sp. AFS]
MKMENLRRKKMKMVDIPNILFVLFLWSCFCVRRNEVIVSSNLCTGLTNYKKEKRFVVRVLSFKRLFVLGFKAH